MKKTELISKVIELEYKLTKASIKGHKHTVGDKYQINRDRLKNYRDKLKEQ